MLAKMKVKPGQSLNQRKVLLHVLLFESCTLARITCHEKWQSKSFMCHKIVPMEDLKLVMLIEGITSEFICIYTDNFHSLFVGISPRSVCTYSVFRP